jgi:hypothetical protein
MISAENKTVVNFFSKNPIEKQYPKYPKIKPDAPIWFVLSPPKSHIPIPLKSMAIIETIKKLLISRIKIKNANKCYNNCYY